MRRGDARGPSHAHPIGASRSEGEDVQANLDAKKGGPEGPPFPRPRWSGYQLVAPVLGQPPTLTVVQVRLVVPSAFFLIVNALPLFEWPTIVYVSAVLAVMLTWPGDEPIVTPDFEPAADSFVASSQEANVCVSA